MQPPRPWSLEEFKIVAANPTLPHAELAALLGERTTGAVATLRIGLHTFHMNETGPAQRLFLPNVVRHYLAQPGLDEVVCAECGVRF